MRRFLQFRLATMLMFIAMCAMALGWWKDHHDLRDELTDLRTKVNAFNVEMDERIGDVLRATDPVGASVAYRNLFAVSGSAGLRRLILDRRDGIAIQSLWEWVHEGLPEDAGTRGVPDPQRFAEFLAILEERAGVKLPTWWVTIVGDLKMDQQNRFSVCDLRNTPTGNTWPVATPDRSYVALCDSREDSPYDLTCEDRTSGATLWKAQVWAVNWRRNQGKFWRNGRVTVIEREGRVFVFGAAAFGVYLEVFRANDGSNLFRFSSAY